MVQSTEVCCRTCPWTRAVALDLLIAKSNHPPPNSPFHRPIVGPSNWSLHFSRQFLFSLNTVHIWHLALPLFNQHRNQEELQLSITLHSKIPPLHFANPSTSGFSSAFFCFTNRGIFLYSALQYGVCRPDNSSSLMIIPSNCPINLRPTDRGYHSFLWFGQRGPASITVAVFLYALVVTPVRIFWRYPFLDRQVFHRNWCFSSSQENSFSGTKWKVVMEADDIFGNRCAGSVFDDANCDRGCFFSGLLDQFFPSYACPFYCYAAAIVFTASFGSNSTEFL